MAGQISLGADWGERFDGEYYRCTECDGKAVLVSAGATWWQIDDEPYKHGEYVNDLEEEMPDGVECDPEITGHFCLKCNKLLSINVHNRT